MKIKGLGILLFFISLYFVVRIPIYKLGLDGQDGNAPNINIFVKRPEKPNYMLVARLDSTEVYVPPTGHPGPMYEMLAIFGQNLRSVLPDQVFAPNNIITTVKMISSVFQLVIFLGILYIVIRQIHSKMPYLLIFLLSLTPLALYNNSEFQLDSLFGLLMVGIFALLMWIYSLKLVSNKLIMFLIFFSAVFIGLGKNEWSLLLFISVFIAFVFSRNKIIDYKTCLSILLGCFAGNVVSYLFEPRLYLSGWNLLLGMSQHNTVFSKGVSRFLDMNVIRSPYTNTCLFLIAYCLYYVWKNIKSVNFPIMLSFIYGSLLFFSFFFATWGWSSRYFAPAFICLSVTAIAIFLNDTKTHFLLRKIPILLVVIIVYFSVQTVWFYRVMGNRFDYGKRDISNILREVNDCVPIIPTEDVMFKQEIDFIHSHEGIEDTKMFVEKYGKKLCPL